MDAEKLAQKIVEGSFIGQPIAEHTLAKAYLAILARERKLVEAWKKMLLFVAAEGQGEDHKFVGLSYRGHDIWGPTGREDYPLFEFAEAVEKWLHEQARAALKGDTPKS